MGKRISENFLSMRQVNFVQALELIKFPPSQGHTNPHAITTSLQSSLASIPCPPSAPTNIDCIQFHFNRKIPLSRPSCKKLRASLDFAEVHQLETQIYAVANISLGGQPGTKQSIVSTAFEYHTTSASLKQKQRGKFMRRNPREKRGSEESRLNTSGKNRIGGSENKLHGATRNLTWSWCVFSVRMACSKGWDERERVSEWEQKIPISSSTVWIKWKTIWSVLAINQRPSGGRRKIEASST